MDIIVFGGWIFWSLTAIFLIIFFSSIHHENRKLSTISFFSYFILLAVFSSIDMVGFVIRNPVLLLIFIASYFLCGIIWAFFKWNIYTSEALNKYNDYKKEWLEKRGITGNTVPEELKKEWKHIAQIYAESLEKVSGYSNHYGNKISEYTGEQIVNAIKPKVKENKGTIIFWLTYWPFNLCYYMFADVIADIWNSIYRKIGNSLQSVSDRKFKGIDSEFEQ